VNAAAGKYKDKVLFVRIPPAHLGDMEKAMAAIQHGSVAYPLHLLNRPAQDGLSAATETAEGELDADTVSKLIDSTLSSRVIHLSPVTVSAVMAAKGTKNMLVLVADPDMFEGEKEALEKLAADHKDDLLVVVADPRMRSSFVQIAAQLVGAQAYPVHLFMNKNGGVMGGAGMLPAEALTKFVDEGSKMPEPKAQTEQPSAPTVAPTPPPTK
jgi:hypothetical protein